MKAFATIVRSRILFAAIATTAFVPFASTQTPAPLHLKPGVYVQPGTNCRNSALAGLIVWDGRGFSGAHATQCVTVQTRPGQKPYHLRTTCTAQGDGTPTAPDAVEQTLWRDSFTSFHMGAADATRFSPTQRFEWSCPASALK